MSLYTWLDQQELRREKRGKGIEVDEVTNWNKNKRLEHWDDVNQHFWGVTQNLVNVT